MQGVRQLGPSEVFASAPGGSDSSVSDTFAAARQAAWQEIPTRRPGAHNPPASVRWRWRSTRNSGDIAFRAPVGPGRLAGTIGAAPWVAQSIPAPEQWRTMCRKQFQAVDCLELIGRAEATPMFAEHAHGRVDLAHHDDDAVAHVARIALDQVGAHVARRAQAGAVVEDAPVAAVGGVPGGVVRPAAALNRCGCAPADSRCGRPPRRKSCAVVGGEQGLLDRRQDRLPARRARACGTGADWCLRSAGSRCRTAPRA